MLISRRTAIKAKIKWMRVQAKSTVFVQVLVDIIKHQPKKLAAAVALVVFCAAALILAKNKKSREIFVCDDDGVYNSLLPESQFKAPNLVHFFRSRTKAANVTLSELTCLKAALRIQGEVYVHSEDPVATENAIARLGFSHSSLTILPAPSSAELPPAVGILWNHGGIFLNNDIYIVRRMDRLRLLNRVMTADGNVLAGSSHAVRTGWFSQIPWETIDGVVLEKDWGALYLLDVLRNCSIKAIRLGGRKSKSLVTM